MIKDVRWGEEESEQLRDINSEREKKKQKYRREGGEIPICGVWVKAGLQVCEALISLQACICVNV